MAFGSVTLTFAREAEWPEGIEAEWPPDIPEPLAEETMVSAPGFDGAEETMVAGPYAGTEETMMAPPAAVDAPPAFPQADEPPPLPP